MRLFDIIDVTTGRKVLSFPKSASRLMRPTQEIGTRPDWYNFHSLRVLLASCDVMFHRYHEDDFALSFPKSASRLMRLETTGDQASVGLSFPKSASRLKRRMELLWTGRIALFFHSLRVLLASCDYRLFS